MNTMPKPNEPRAGDAGPGPAAGCLDDNLIVAYAEQRLEAARRERVEGHLAGCDACRGLVLELAPVLAAGAPEQPLAHAEPAARLEAGLRPTFRRPGRVVGVVLAAAAAAVLVAAGLGLRELLSEAGRLGGISDGPADDAPLTRALARAQALRPGTLAGFRPLSPAELEVGPPAPPLRGGVALLRPAPLVLEERPVVEWLPQAGLTRWSVRVIDAADGRTVLWERSATEPRVAWPPEAPALSRAVLVEVSGRGPLGPVVGRRAVAPFPDREAFAADAAALSEAGRGSVRYSSRGFSSKEGGLGDQSVSQWDVSLSDPGGFRFLGWGVAYSRTDTDGDTSTSRSSTEEVIRGTLFANISPQFRMRGIVG